jgi:hypothetical protein
MSDAHSSHSTDTIGNVTRSGGLVRKTLHFLAKSDAILLGYTDTSRGADLFADVAVNGTAIVTAPRGAGLRSDRREHAGFAAAATACYVLTDIR